MSKPVLNVVVTCTKQKRFSVPADLCVSTLKKGTLPSRFDQWRDRLSNSKAEKCKVADLYSGDHWATVRKFNSSVFRVKLWVTSAGYGLVEPEDKIAPYAATFSKNHKDSICNNLSGEISDLAPKLWWKQLTTWRFSRHCRSLKSLAKSRPTEPFLIVASDTYLKAFGDDLAHARKQLADPDLLSILSAGCKSLNGVSDNILPCDARLQFAVGGARRSLNTRTASHLISNAKSLPSFSKLKTTLLKLLKDLPAIPTYDRTPTTDNDVLRFIQSELNSDPKQAHSPLLRKFRSSGRACEQSRFRDLYMQIKAEIV